MSNDYFSDRELGPRPRVEEELSDSAWGGIVATIRSRLADGSFGYKYPLECEDGHGTYGCDDHLFSIAIKAEVPDISWPLNPHQVPATLVALDLLEFCHRCVAKPIQQDYHSFYRHHHLQFERDEGQEAYRNDVNRIFARNGLAYELSFDGRIVRLAPVVLRESLASAVFRTEDAELNSMLESARKKYLDPNIEIRRESLEKLWDAWERLKTLEPGKDKKESAGILLDRAASEPNFRETLENEARELTRIGNTFRIRHSETSQVPLALSEYVDYLFHRLFSLIQLLLRVTGRGG